MRITHYMYFEDLNGFASASRHIFPRNHHRFLTDSVTLAGRTAAE